jgi:hypothetical protein
MANGITLRAFLRFSAGTAAGIALFGFDTGPAFGRVGSLKIGMAKVSKTVCIEMAFQKRSHLQSHCLKE